MDLQNMAKDGNNIVKLKKSQDGTEKWKKIYIGYSLRKDKEAVQCRRDKYKTD